MINMEIMMIMVFMVIMVIEVIMVNMEVIMIRVNMVFAIVKNMAIGHVKQDEDVMSLLLLKRIYWFYFQAEVAEQAAGRM